jgi:hypothetical protein
MSHERLELITALVSAVCYKFPPKINSIVPKPYNRED